MRHLKLLITGAAFAVAARCFDEIPSGPAPVAVAPQSLRAVSPPPSLCLEDRIELPRIYLAWPTPALFADGDADLDLLSEVLAGGKSSRLHRALLHDRELATDGAAGQESREISGLFTIAATAAPGAALSEIEAVVVGEVDARPEGGGRNADYTAGRRARKEARRLGMTARELAVASYWSEDTVC